MKILPNVTLIFLVKKINNEIVKICLALKKRGFGMGKWNGVGGKLCMNESIEDGAKREAKEEIGIEVVSLKKVAINEFYFSNNPEWNQRVHIFVCDKWRGEIKESEEMSPKWFNRENIPYDKMWIDDILWLPKILSGEKIKAKFIFGNEVNIIEKEIKTCEIL